MISDDDLLLYYYRDGLDAAERARIGAALASNPSSPSGCIGLVAHLDAAAAMPEVPVPAHIQQRWQAALERAARSKERRACAAAAVVGSSHGWLAAAAAAAVVALIW